MDSNHLNKQAYRSKSGKKNYCNNNDKHREKQKVKDEDVNKKDFKITKCGEGKSENILFFILIMCLSLYDYQAKASRHRKRFTYSKNRASTNQNQTLQSQKLKRKVLKHKMNRNHPTK